MKNSPNTTSKIIIPKKPGNGSVSQELLDSLKSISDEDIQRIGKEMEKAKKIRIQREEEMEKEKEKQEKIEKFKGDTDVILKDLKENHVRIEENAKMMGYKGKKVHIDLPAVGNFKGFNFDYFVSNCGVLKGKLGNKPKLEKKLYSMKDVSKLLQAMNEYMSELQGKNDGNIDYENELKCWNEKIIRNRCNAGDCLKAITGLNIGYWLSDKENFAGRYQRAEWTCHNDCCYFYRYLSEHNCANLFLKLSD